MISPQFLLDASKRPTYAAIWHKRSICQYIIYDIIYDAKKLIEAPAWVGEVLDWLIFDMPRFFSRPSLSWLTKVFCSSWEENSKLAVEISR